MSSYSVVQLLFVKTFSWILGKVVPAVVFEADKKYGCVPTRDVLGSTDKLDSVAQASNGAEQNPEHSGRA